MRVLVTGGAGYIGSHAIQALKKAGHSPVCVDNLSRGHRAAVPDDVPFFQLDVRQTEELRSLLVGQAIECVMHFAAYAYVGESVTEPLLYYDNNTRGTHSVLAAIEAAKIQRLVFSSTCATYGEPKEMPIRETTPQAPINPYGASKWMSERMIQDFAHKTPGFSYALLRYFNVAGSAEDGSIGEDHDPETHLIPVILQAALGRRAQVTIFGDDYPTADGTCIRDYIHVEDLVEAHIAVMQALAPGDARIYNLGIGRGLSVLEILSAAERVIGRPIARSVGARRPGDPPALFADAEKIAREIGWRARRTDIEAAIRSAYRFIEAHPKGYGD